MATRGNDVVSVEVTSKVEGDLTVKTINNTLHAKRNQVPATRPAVLYMHIPAEWMRRDNAYRILSEAIVEFSLRSKRFNSIVFVWEEVVPHMNGGIPQMIMHACYHNFPRHRFEPLNLFEPMGTEDQQGKVAHSLIHALRKHRDALQNKG